MLFHSQDRAIQGKGPVSFTAGPFFSQYCEYLPGQGNLGGWWGKILVIFTKKRNKDLILETEGWEVNPSRICNQWYLTLSKKMRMYIKKSFNISSNEIKIISAFIVFKVLSLTTPISFYCHCFSLYILQLRRWGKGCLFISKYFFGVWLVCDMNKAFLGRERFAFFYSIRWGPDFIISHPIEDTSSGTLGLEHQSR